MNESLDPTRVVKFVEEPADNQTQEWTLNERTAVAYARASHDDTDFSVTLEGAKAGEEWAWAALYRDLAGPVKGYLGSRGASDPEDLCSETFLQVAKGIGQFSGEYEAFRSWVFVIAHRRLIDHRRKQGRRPKTVPDEGQLALVTDDRHRVDETVLSRLADSRISEILEHLTEDQREVLALRVIADLSVKQTADVMGKRPGAVKALQRRALAAVRQVLDESGVTL